ncbi:hypothetical protein HDU99_005577, partial [Rhizoclosmatium hyalinum]
MAINFLLSDEPEEECVNNWSSQEPLPATAVSAIQTNQNLTYKSQVHYHRPKSVANHHTPQQIPLPNSQQPTAKTFECTQCLKTFTKKAYLKSHW